MNTTQSGHVSVSENLVEVLKRGVECDEKRTDMLGKLAHSQLLAQILAYATDAERKRLIDIETEKLNLANELELKRLRKDIDS